MRRNSVLSRLALFGAVALLAAVSSYSQAVAATIIVDTASDTVADDGQCSLREANTSANTDTASGATTGECPAGSGADTITLPADTYTLTSGSELAISSDLTLTGDSPSSTIIQASAESDVATHGVLGIYGGPVTISGVTIRFGRPGITNQATLDLTDCVVSSNRVPQTGGGIFNDASGNLTLTNCTVSNNIAGGDSGGIHNQGMLTITGSTIANNQGNGGGGIRNAGAGVLDIRNSTVSGNFALNHGGGIHGPGGTMTITNSTIVGNTSDLGVGGGVANFATMNLVNSIVALNSSNTGPDCFGSPNSLGNNLIGNSVGCAFNQTTGDLIDLDPKLSALADNGGPTFTHALLSGSPAIDAGNPATPGSGGNACESSDQRGTTRPQGSACDIGAYELVSAAAVPGLTGWGLIALAGLLAIVLTWRLRRRTAAAS